MITELCGLTIGRTFILKNIVQCSFNFLFFGNLSAVILLMQYDPLTVLSGQALPTCFAYHQTSGML